MARIRFEGLTKHFDGNLVLAPLDLEIADGEFFTFVGPSGCGKSTLLSLVAGVEAPSEGAIWFDDVRIDALAPGKRDVAMVFQSYALYPHLSVRDNIAFPLRARGRKAGEIATEVQEVAQMLGLAELLDRKPRQLSGGQRQRVALGRALVRRPKVFLMDEPLSNLDARLRLEMREELKRLHASHGITTIYVTHDQEEAMALSGRLAVLSGGRIQQCGVPKAVYDDPANLFAAQFVGSPPMNIVERDGLGPMPGIEYLLPGWAGSDVVLGVRPTDLAVCSVACEGLLAAEVLITETTGSDLWVVCRANGQRLRGRAAGRATFVSGGAAYVQVDWSKVYAFDRATGARLRPELSLDLRGSAQSTQ